MKTLRKSAIKLTKAEFDLVSRTDYPKMKQRIMRKTVQRFDALGCLMKDAVELPAGIAPSFKTTRGENYRGLPYAVLDFPQIKGNGFTLCCRTMFWWGRYCSLNVIIRSDAVDIAELAQKLKASSLKKVRILTGDDLWQQDLDHADFTKLKELDEAALAELLKGREYIKISRKVSLRKWKELEVRSLEFYRAVLGLL